MFEFDGNEKIERIPAKSKYTRSRRARSFFSNKFVNRTTFIGVGLSIIVVVTIGFILIRAQAPDLFTKDDYYCKLESIQDFYITTNDDNVVVVGWSSRFRHCKIYIDVNGDTLGPFEKVTSTYLDTYDFQYCLSYIITARAEDSHGNGDGEVRMVFEKGTGEILDATQDGTIIEWISSSNSEECQFLIQLDGEIVALIRGQSYDFSNEDLTPCKAHVVTITPIGVNSKAGTSYLKSDFEIFAEIEKLELVDNKAITWKSPNIGKCRFSIKINSDEALNLTTHTSFDLTVLNLDVCVTHTFDICSVNSNGDSDVMYTLPFQILPQLSNLNFDGNILSWNTSAFSDQCAFQILINGDEAEKVTATSIDLLLRYNLSFCVKYEISVTPVNFIDENTGNALSDEVIFFTTIEDITVIDSTIYWTTSHDANQCKFEIEINVEGFLVIDMLDAKAYDITDLDLNYCVEHDVQIRIKDQTGKITGNLKTKTFQLELESIQDFYTTINDDDRVIAGWSMRFQHCKIYIDVNGDSLGPFEEVTSVYLDTYDFQYCLSYTITARAEDSNGNSNDEIQMVFEKGTGEILDARQDGTLIEWVSSSNSDECKFLIELDDKIVALIRGRSYNFSSEDLTPCKSHVVTILPIGVSPYFTKGTKNMKNSIINIYYC